mgnify:CR=1 FL=1
MKRGVNVGGGGLGMGVALIGACGLAATLTGPTAQAQIEWKAMPQTPLVIGAQQDIAMRLRNLGVDGRGVVQLNLAATQSGRETLAKLGLRLLAPLGHDAFFCKLDAQPNFVGLERSGWIRGVVNIDPTWKIDPRLQEQDVLALWGPQATGGEEGASTGSNLAADPVIPVYVYLHEDLDTNLATQGMLQQYTTRVTGALQSVPIFIAEMHQSQVGMLALEQGVQFIGPAMPMMTETNAQNRVRTGADIANAAPYNLNGAGVSVLVFDSGFARATHQTFGGRLTVIDTGDALSSHSTHVAGTVGGSGAGSNNPVHAGMAPGCTLLSAGFAGTSLPSGWLYTNPVDIEADYTNAYTLGADLGTNSIGTNVTSNGFSCTWLGDYNATDILIDSMVRGRQSVSQGNPFRIVWAAGNERQGSACDSATAFPYYYVAPPAGAKNHLSIGALNSNDDSMTSFSSWGPTDDGRMKPDFCGPGCQSDGDQGVTSASSSGDTAYASLCGTSMATPTVAGLTAIFLQDFRAQFPLATDPRNSTLKAIYSQTAVDLGHPGPDYSHGYGSMGIIPALQLMRDGRFDEFSVEQDETQTFVVTIPSGQPRFSTTIAWDDQPGTVNTLPELVNDVDIEVLGPNGAMYMPWTLLPSTPDVNAVQTAQNRRDNLEQVDILNPPAGQYTIRISGFNIPQGPQPVSIASTHGITFSGSVPLVRLEPVQLAPSLVGPGLSQEVRLKTRVFQDTLVPGSVVVKVSANGPTGTFQSVPMTLAQDGDWVATIPAQLCGSQPTYYFSATGQTVGTVTLPADISQQTYGFNVGVYVTADSDAMEVASGWSLAAIGDTATLGTWQRGDPESTTIQPADDTTAGTGRFCYVTDPRAGSSVNSYDVDNGATTLTSRTFDMSGLVAPRVQFSRWYANGTPSSGAARNDSMPILVSYDNGSTWVTLEDVGTGGAVFNGGWQTATYQLSQSSGQTKFRFIARDLAPDSSVEALIDDISVQGLECANPPRVCDSIDFNNDASLFDPVDVDAFLSVFSEGPCLPAGSTCNDIDFNNDGSQFDPADIDSFLSVFSEGPCL